jgi:hypothetical protein
MQFEHWIRFDVQGTEEARDVESLARLLLSALGEEPARSGLVAANQPSASSHAVQRVILPAATELGFISEERGLFQGSVRGLRPDFYRKVGDSSGILLEVERGKTTTNNMDLLDFWKCHLCEQAHYLFLFVPCQLKHSEGSGIKREFENVRRRLGAFFLPGNATNVRGLFLFGY